MENGHRESLSLMAALNRDALEEVFLHCAPPDLLAMRQTCGAAADLLGRSEKVWLAKLRESFGLSLKAPAGGDDGLFVRLARRVYEASQGQALRFQGVYVGGGVDEDAMHYFVDNLFRNDKAPYCSNCSANADCVALLLDGEVPRDADFARVRQYMIRRCRYAAALIMNVQMPEHGRDPDDIMRILEDWTDIQLEGFFKDLVGAMQAEHALGRLLIYDVPHERVAAEEQKILGVHQWLLDRPRVMKAAMLKPPDQPNAMFDTSVLPKLCGGAGSRQLAGVVHEVSLSRVGNLTCPVAAGAVLVGHFDHSKVAGWSAEEVLALLQRATADPTATALNSLTDAGEVAAAAAAGLLPPILATDETLSGIWHEFDTSEAGAAAQAAAAVAAGMEPGSSSRAMQQQQPGEAAGPSGGAAAGKAQAEAPGPSGSGGVAGEVSPAGIISLRPLLWFKFHSADEATAFLQRNRSLIEQHGAQATVRHRGPAPRRRGHFAAAAAAEAAKAAQALAQQQAVAPVAAAAAAQQPGWLAGQLLQAAMLAPGAQQMQGGPQHVQQQQLLQHPQQHPQQQQQQQQAVVPAAWQPQPAAFQPAGGMPAAHFQVQGPPPGAAGAPPGPLQQPGGLGIGPGAAAAAAGGPGSQDSEGDEEGSEGSLDMDDDDLTDDSGLDIDEGVEAQGAWLANWVQDEFGADLQQEQDVVVAGEGIPFDQMEEDSSSEGEDDDEALLGAEEHFDLGAPGGGAGLAGLAGGQGGHPLPQVQRSAAETLLRAVSRRNTRARNRLRVPLTRPIGANILLVKLISQENLMQEYGDPHGWPNIDMSCITLTGRSVELPESVTLVP